MTRQAAAAASLLLSRAAAAAAAVTRVKRSLFIDFRSSGCTCVRSFARSLLRRAFAFSGSQLRGEAEIQREGPRRERRPRREERVTGDCAERRGAFFFRLDFLARSRAIEREGDPGVVHASLHARYFSDSRRRGVKSVENRRRPPPSPLMISPRKNAGRWINKGCLQPRRPNKTLLRSTRALLKHLAVAQRSAPPPSPVDFQYTASSPFVPPPNCTRTLRDAPRQETRPSHERGGKKTTHTPGQKCVPHYPEMHLPRKRE